MAKKPAKAARKAPNVVTLTVRVTPEGLAEARKQIDAMEEQARKQAGQELLELTNQVRSRTADLFAGMDRGRGHGRHPGNGRRSPG